MCKNLYDEASRVGTRESEQRKVKSLLFLFRSGAIEESSHNRLSPKLKLKAGT